MSESEIPPSASFYHTLDSVLVEDVGLMEQEVVGDNLENDNSPMRDLNPSSEQKTIISQKFEWFLLNYFNEFDASRQKVFIERIKSMCEHNQSSFTIEFPILNDKEVLVTHFLVKAPLKMLEIFDEVGEKVVRSMFPNYNRVSKKIHVRIADFPITIEPLSTLRNSNVDRLVRTMALVTATTQVMPQLTITYLNCGSCSSIFGPLHHTRDVQPNHCPQCLSSGPFTIKKEESLFRSYQKIKMQVFPSGSPAGESPQSIDCILLADLCDKCKPGDEIDITGIYVDNLASPLNAGKMFTSQFSPVIIANHLVLRDCKHIAQSLTENDISTIKEMSKNPKISEKIIASIAPSIFGHENIKRALALSLFGGGEKSKIRDNINILICGDSGTAKSQFLKCAANSVRKAVCINGANTAGLTAFVEKDPATEVCTLEAGALVLADQGMCLIDEFDKMNDEIRTSLYETMEQQSISIATGDKVTTLQARCSIIAASNPIGGRYNHSMTFTENVSLGDSVLTKFDIVCVVKDEVDPDRDQDLARFVLSSHNDPSREVEDVGNELQISKEMLIKYIGYAKGNIHPKLQNLDQDKVAGIYSELRQKSVATGNVPIAVRHLESIIRITKAHAKMHLREYVQEEDVNMAVRMILESFIETQKYSVMESMKKVFKKYLLFQKDHNESLLHILRELSRDQGGSRRHTNGTVGYGTQTLIIIDEKGLIERAKQIDLHDVKPFYQSEIFERNNYVYDAERKIIIHIGPEPR